MKGLLIGKYSVLNPGAGRGQLFRFKTTSRCA
jgi:hypothetical protein